MIQILSSRIVDYLISHSAIDIEDQELYKYAINVAALTVLPMILVLIWGVICHGLFEGIVIMFPFMLIRKYSGGYHTKRAWTCTVSSSLILILCIYIAMHAKCNGIVFLLNGGACISLIVFSPAEHENKRLCEEERKRYRKQVERIVSGIYLLCIITYWIHIPRITLCLSIACIMSAIMQIPLVINNYRYIYHLRS